jgi:pyrroline-5-carboxylate reductase
VLRIDHEPAFEAMSATTATLASHLRSLEVMSRWLAAHGVGQEAATRYIASMYAGLGRSLDPAPHDIGALAAEYATPGGTNERFAGMLDDAGLVAAIERSLDAILEGLTESPRAR